MENLILWLHETGWGAGGSQKPGLIDPGCHLVGDFWATWRGWETLPA